MASAALPTALWKKEGIAHFHKNEFADALVYFDQYLAAHPSDRDLLNYKARTLEALGRAEDSLACVERCLELEPKDLHELGNRAVLLTKLSRRSEALASLDEILSLEPNHTLVLVRRAHLLHQLGRKEEALRSAERAVHGAPSDLNALNMKGMILDDLGRHAEARADFEKILSKEPNHAEAITNIGIGHGRGGRFREALACYDRSLAINPAQDNATYNRAVVRLALGDLIEGFRDFERRWKLFPHEAARLTRLAPLWLGQCELKGKTVLLHHEQGFGDTLQFSRYAGLVKALGANVIVAIPDALRRLMQTLPGAPRIIAEGEPIPVHDFHCPMMSLPLAFHTTLNHVPSAIPYLRADRQLSRAWRDRLAHRSRPRIGLVWSGRRYPPINHARDMSFETAAPLLALRAEFFCLHTELSDAEQSAISPHPNLTWVGKDLTDFADTAALIDNLDLLITVDTAAAHLAGAMGKPVWLMNRYASCWRWLLDRSDSPWYPSLRLFRQPALGDWLSVIREVLNAGDSFVGNFAQRGPSRASGIAAQEREFATELQLALDFHNRGRWEEAIVGYGRALLRIPDNADAVHYLGVALAQTGRFEEALACLSRALRAQPRNARLHNHCGNTLTSLRRFDEALAAYDCAIAHDQELPDAHFNKGVALEALGRSEEALLSYEQAIRIDPCQAKAHNNRGNILSDGLRDLEALASYDRALQADPKCADAWINKSHVQRRLHRYEAAIDAAANGVKYGPDNAEAHNAQGAALAALGRFEEASVSYQRSFGLNPGFTEAVWNNGLVELAQGDFKRGWPHYEARWSVKSLKLTRRFPESGQWSGRQSLAGKRVLLHAEQGYGDSIQFARYCARVAALGAHVILMVPASLKHLFTSLEGVHELVDQAAAPAFDFHCPLMSLPFALGTELHFIPAPRRYLSAQKERRIAWGVRLGERSGTPRVGLTWSGRSSHSNDANRSMPFEWLLPLTQQPVRLYGLQKEIRSSDQEYLARAPGICQLGEELGDFADAAALIENLDLIVTVDTSIAHLVGALGVPVCILLPHVADWRWLQEREDTPWYPSARLFRQSRAGDWASVIGRVNIELQELAESFTPEPLQSKMSSSSSRATGPAPRVRRRPPQRCDQ